MFVAYAPNKGEWAKEEVLELQTFENINNVVLKLNLYNTHTSSSTQCSQIHVTDRLTSTVQYSI